MRQFRSLALLSLASLTVWLSPDEASAQRVRYGVGLGYGGVRVGIGRGPIYGPGYGRYGYGPAYGYGNGPSPLVVRPQGTQRPVGGSESNLPTTSSSLADGGEILLFNPASNPGDAHYTLNGIPYTMPPGTKQQFVNDRTWTIEFESSPGRVSKYTLTSSRYKFKASDAGLGLFQTQDLPESTPRSLSAPPIPNPPESSAADSEGTVVPPRPRQKATP